MRRGPIGPRETRVLDYAIAHLLEHHTHAKHTDILIGCDMYSKDALVAALELLEHHGYIGVRPGRHGFKILKRSDGRPFQLVSSE